MSNVSDHSWLLMAVGNTESTNTSACRSRQNKNDRWGTARPCVGPPIPENSCAGIRDVKTGSSSGFTPEKGDGPGAKEGIMVVVGQADQFTNVVQAGRGLARVKVLQECVEGVIRWDPVAAVQTREQREWGNVFAVHKRSSADQWLCEDSAMRTCSSVPCKRRQPNEAWGRSTSPTHNGDGLEQGSSIARPNSPPHHHFSRPQFFVAQTGDIKL